MSTYRPTVGAAWRAGVIAAIVAALIAAAPAGAQTVNQAASPTTDGQPVYTATPPTRGALASDGPTGRYLLGGQWLYRPDMGDVGMSQGWWRNTASTDGWNPVTVPDSYNARQLTRASMHGYVGWYRRDFTLPAGAFPSYVPRGDRSWLIQFESVNYSATVWLNGHRLGAHQIANLPFEFTLKHLQPGVNRLIVRVDDRRTPADFPPGPDGGWWNFGGILDAVYLRPVARADLDSVLIRPELPCPGCAATVYEQATVHNLTGRPQRVRLKGHFGVYAISFGATTIPAGGTWTPSAQIVIRHPRLWSLFAPRLYRVSLILSDHRHRRLGGYAYESGIRMIRLTKAGGIKLNGRLLNLRGVNIHEQTASTGAALDVAQMRQLLDWAKQLGAGIIRVHYPLAPEMEEMADRAGILLWSEVPVYKATNANLAQDAWLQQALKLLRHNIEANQDHPSILLWSIGNELSSGMTAGQARYIRQAAAEARRLDPTRPVGMAVLDWPGIGCQRAYAPLDVVGLNEYFGWFDSGGGGNDDRDQLSPFLDSVHACYPHQALIISEFGFGGVQSGPVEDRGTYQNQVNNLQFHLNVFASKPYISGAIYFPMQDFAAYPGFDGQDPLGTPPIVDKGVLDRFGNPKPGFAVMQSVYHSTQQIAPAR